MSLSPLSYHHEATKLALIYCNLPPTLASNKVDREVAASSAVPWSESRCCNVHFLPIPSWPSIICRRTGTKRRIRSGNSEPFSSAGSVSYQTRVRGPHRFLVNKCSTSHSTNSFFAAVWTNCSTSSSFVLRLPHLPSTSDLLIVPFS